MAGKPAVPRSVAATMTWQDGVFAAFDTETTSPDPLTARIVSAALIVDVPGQEPVITEWLADCGTEIPLEATAIHGISTEHARKHGSPAAVILPEIMAAISGLEAAYGTIPLVIMNAVFDLTIMDRDARRNGLGGYQCPLPVFDPMVLDRRLDPYRPGRRTLTAIAASYGVAIQGAHQAQGDCMASLRLARAICAKYGLISVTSLEDLQDVQRAGQRAWAENFTKFRRIADPLFTCPGDWPAIPWDEREAALCPPGSMHAARPGNGPTLTRKPGNVTLRSPVKSTACHRSLHGGCGIAGPGPLVRGMS
jgi:DNA polymerase III subunit epsilon